MAVWVRLLSLYLPLVALVVAFYALLVWFQQPDRFPLRVVEIRSELKYLTEDEIKSTTLPFLAKGFFGLDGKGLRDALTALPWAESVNVRRAWPDRLQVSVREHVGQAQWGKTGVLSTNGVLFFPSENAVPVGLPEFKGSTVRAKEMLGQYLDLLELLAPVGLSVQTLEVTPKGVWHAVLDNGISLILGRSGLSESVARFVLAYQSRLQSKSQRVAYVDLRYTNGVAVGWK